MALSETVESQPDIMPRLGRRVELFSAIKRSGYLLRIRQQQNHVRSRFLDSFLWRFYGRRSRFFSSGLRQSRRSVDSLGKHMQFIEMLGAQEEGFLLDLRRDTVVTMLRERYLEPRVSLPRSTEWLSRVLAESPDRIFRQHARMSRESFWGGRSDS